MLTNKTSPRCHSSSGIICVVLHLNFTVYHLPIMSTIILCSCANCLVVEYVCTGISSAIRVFATSR